MGEHGFEILGTSPASHAPVHRNRGLLTTGGVGVNAAPFLVSSGCQTANHEAMYLLTGSRVAGSREMTFRSSNASFMLAQYHRGIMYVCMYSHIHTCRKKSSGRLDHHVKPRLLTVRNPPNSSEQPSGAHFDGKSSQKKVYYGAYIHDVGS